ncbi:MAG: hypothetical protein USCAAHI_00001 [Beijerinckiaceae bacterium]|nr:MAG: hypothetical protein USCAAHI_00001 [Beijerinckiaceae bacterium]
MFEPQVFCRSALQSGNPDARHTRSLYSTTLPAGVVFARTDRFYAAINRKLSARPAIPSGLFEHRIFDEVYDHRDDRATDAAADRIAKRRADVESAAGGCAAEGGNQALKEGATNPSADGAGNRFGKWAEDDVLEKAPAAFPPIAPLTIWIMRLMIVPDIFVSCFCRSEWDGAERCRGLVSYGNQLAGEKYICFDTVFAKLEPVNPKTIMRRKERIKLEGRRPAGLGAGRERGRASTP